jgi:hypothetical protein
MYVLRDPRHSEYFCNRCVVGMQMSRPYWVFFFISEMRRIIERIFSREVVIRSQTNLVAATPKPKDIFKGTKMMKRQNYIGEEDPD